MVNIQCERPRKPRTWRLLGMERPSDFSTRIEFTCTSCGNESMLPVSGLALAQKNDALIFDGAHAMPSKIQWRHCVRPLAL